MRWPVLFGIRPSFPGLSQSSGQVPHVILTRSPLIHPQQAGSFSVRLACVKHAASVHPEPGSNSPYKTYEKIQSTGPSGKPSPWQKTTTNHTENAISHGNNHSKINGIKQTWHTIEFSNNHHHPPTTPQHAEQPPGSKPTTHNQTVMNHTKTGATHNTKQRRRRSQIRLAGV